MIDLQAWFAKLNPGDEVLLKEGRGIVSLAILTVESRNNNGALVLTDGDRKFIFQSYKRGSGPAENAQIRPLTDDLREEVLLQTARNAVLNKLRHKIGNLGPETLKILDFVMDNPAAPEIQILHHLPSVQGVKLATPRGSRTSLN